MEYAVFLHANKRLIQFPQNSFNLNLGIRVGAVYGDLVLYGYESICTVIDWPGELLSGNITLQYVYVSMDLRYLTYHGSLQSLACILLCLSTSIRRSIRNT